MAPGAGIVAAAEHNGETFPLIDKLGSYLPLLPAEIEFLRDPIDGKGGSTATAISSLRAALIGASSFCAAASSAGIRSFLAESDKCSISDCRAI
jgi:hypothetical protein